MIYPPMTTGRAYEYDVYEKFRKDLLEMTELFPGILISHHAANLANIDYKGIVYMIAMKFFNIGEKPWYEINSFKPIKISKDYELLRSEYWSKVSLTLSKVSDDYDIEYKMYPITISKKRFYSVDRSHHKTLNSFDEIKNDVQIWMNEINKKILKARIEAI